MLSVVLHSRVSNVMVIALGDAQRTFDLVVEAGFVHMMMLEVSVEYDSATPCEWEWNITLQVILRSYFH